MKRVGASPAGCTPAARAAAAAATTRCETRLGIARSSVYPRSDRVLAFRWAEAGWHGDYVACDLDHSLFDKEGERARREQPSGRLTMTIAIRAAVAI